MSDQLKPSQPLDDKKKNALMRYIFILFAVAFLLILLSFFMQLRDTNQTISELVQSNASALQNAEKLQEDNRKLVDERETWQENFSVELELAEDANEGLQGELEFSENQVKVLITDVEMLEELVKETTRNYENLLGAENALNAGDIAGAKAYLPALRESDASLGNEGHERYEALLVAIELAEKMVETPEEN